MLLTIVLIGKQLVLVTETSVVNVIIGCFPTGMECCNKLLNLNKHLCVAKNRFLIGKCLKHLLLFVTTGFFPREWKCCHKLPNRTPVCRKRVLIGKQLRVSDLNQMLLLI